MIRIMRCPEEVRIHMAAADSKRSKGSQQRGYACPFVFSQCNHITGFGRKQYGKGMERVCGVFEALVSVLLTIAVVLKVDVRIILLGCFVYLAIVIKGCVFRLANKKISDN